MDDDFVKRWIVKVDQHRFLMYDDEDDIDDWDGVLEIRIPATMAHLFDFVQHSYYTMQQYMEAQWHLIHVKLAEDEIPYSDEEPPIFEEVAGNQEMVFDGDSMAFMQRFDAIIRENGLDDMEEE